MVRQNRVNPTSSGMLKSLQMIRSSSRESGLNAGTSGNFKSVRLHSSTTFKDSKVILPFLEKVKTEVEDGISGSLKVKRGTSKIWRDRFCRIDTKTGMLYCFEQTCSRGTQRLKTEIDLESIRSVAKCSMTTLNTIWPFSFKVITDKETWYFSAEHGGSVTTWVSALEKNLRYDSAKIEARASSHMLLEQHEKKIKMTQSLARLASTKSFRYKSEGLRIPLKSERFSVLGKIPTAVVDVSLLAIQDCDFNNPDNWVERHPALHRLTGDHPVNAEPLVNYFDFTLPTPKEISFVRNHGPCPKIEIQDWDLTIVSAAGEKFVFTLNDLKSMPSEEVMATCICAGIRRMELNVVKMTRGSNYGNGAWHTGVFEGVMLRDVFARCGIKPTGGKFEWVETEGHEDLPKGKYTTCLSLERVLDYSQDVMLAYLQNGDPLMPDHGFPVRLIAPGIFGGRWTKCIRKIRILDHESTHFYHLHDNRVLPPYIEEDTPNLNDYFENNLYTYWYHPVNSYIAEPRHGTVCPLADGGIVPIRGVAYNGNGIMITRVELSLDGAKSWRPCTVTYTSTPRHGFKYWNPFFWEPQEPVTTLELFTKKVDELIVRAFDQNLNTQPIDSTWNLLGFANNCLYRVKLETRVSRDEPAYQFIHPVNQCAKIEDCTGWIAKERNREKKRWLPRPKNKKYLPPISIDEVANHDEEDDGWFIIDGVVYDVTQYISDNKHPGGNATLIPFLGLDCSEAFHAVGHSPAAQPDLEACAIGMIGLIGGNNMERTISMLPAVAPKVIEIPFKLIHKDIVNFSKTLIRIVLLGPEGTGYIADEPIGGHYSIINKNVRRSYTPLEIKKEGNRAEIEYSIKVYEDGELTPWIDKQEVGDTIMMAGPKGHIHYAVENIGFFSIAGQTEKRYKKVSMIAGGTGIAPMLQLLRYIYQNTEDSQERMDLHDLALVYSVRTADEIMERGELEKYGCDFVTVKFHVTKECGKRVDADIIEEVCGWGTDESLGLICGPPKFCDAMYTYFSQLNYGSIVTY